MLVPCTPNYVLWQDLPDGLALYPFTRDPHGHETWLAHEEILARLERLDRPTVRVDLKRLTFISSASLLELLRLYKRAVGPGGSLTCYNARPQIYDFFELILPSQRRLPQFTVTREPMPDGELPDPAWLAWNDGAAQALARQIESDQDFRLMPILADALEDAGCTCQDILDHARGPVSEHLKNKCWLIHLLLGT